MSAPDLDVTPVDKAADDYAHENTFDNEWSQVRNAFLAGVEWARRNPETVKLVTPPDKAGG